MASSATATAAAAAASTLTRSSSGGSSSSLMSALPSWAKHIESALAKGGPTSRFVYLATVESGLDPAAQALPRVRTVAFRGWHGTSGAFFVVSDSRHQKYDQLESFPRFEVCWYLYEERQQFRIAGQAKLINQHIKAPELLKLRQDTWQGLSTSTKQQYSYPYPGQPLEAKAVDDAVHSQPADTPPDNFALLLLEPDSVDHLALTEPLMRMRYRRPPDNSGWLPPAPLNP